MASLLGPPSGPSPPAAMVEQREDNLLDAIAQAYEVTDKGPELDIKDAHSLTKYVAGFQAYRPYSGKVIINLLRAKAGVL